MHKKQLSDKKWHYVVNKWWHINSRKGRRQVERSLLSSTVKEGLRRPGVVFLSQALKAGRRAMGGGENVTH